MPDPGVKSVTTSPQSLEPERPDQKPNHDSEPESHELALPAGIQPGVVVQQVVPKDKPVLVAHAPAGVRRAALYLHGVCGDIDAIRSWAEAAAKRFTLIALLADERCGNGGRYRWTGNTAAQERRIDAALESVKQARGGALDTDTRVLIGYSQGALRALALRAQYPERYPWLLLGGLPTETPASRVAGVRRVALIAGEREGKSHIEATAQHFTQGAISSQLFILPGAGHGQYGPRAAEVMSGAFEWLLQ